MLTYNVNRDLFFSFIFFYSIFIFQSYNCNYVKIKRKGFVLRKLLEFLHNLHITYNENFRSHYKVSIYNNSIYTTFIDLSKKEYCKITITSVLITLMTNNQ